MVDFLKEAAIGNTLRPPCADEPPGLNVLETLTPLVTAEQTIGTLYMAPYTSLCLAVTYTDGSLLNTDIYVKWGVVAPGTYIDNIWIYDISDALMLPIQKKYRLEADAVTLCQFRNPGMPWVTLFYNGNAGNYADSAMQIYAYRGWSDAMPIAVVA